MKKIKYLLISILIATNAYTTPNPTFGYGQKYRDPNIKDDSNTGDISFALIFGTFGGVTGTAGGIAGAYLLYKWYRNKFVLNIPIDRFYSDNLIPLTTKQDLLPLLNQPQELNNSYEDPIDFENYSLNEDTYQLIVRNTNGTYEIEKELYNKKSYENLVNKSTNEGVAFISPITTREIVASLQPTIKKIKLYNNANSFKYTIDCDGQDFELLGLKSFAPDYFDGRQKKLIFKHKNGRFYTMRYVTDKLMRRFYPSSHNNHIIYDFKPNQSGNPYHLQTDNVVRL